MEVSGQLRIDFWTGQKIYSRTFKLDGVNPIEEGLITEPGVRKKILKRRKLQRKRMSERSAVRVELKTDFAGSYDRSMDDGVVSILIGRADLFLINLDITPRMGG